MRGLNDAKVAAEGTSGGTSGGGKRAQEAQAEWKIRAQAGAQAEVGRGHRRQKLSGTRGHKRRHKRCVFFRCPNAVVSLCVALVLLCCSFALALL